MKNILFILLSSCIVFCATSCERDVEEERSGIITYVFKNDSGHSLSIEISEAKGEINKETRKPSSFKKIISLDIPKGTSAYQDIMSGFLSLAVMDFYTCSIVFDDGKKLEYSKETIDDTIADRTSPLSIMAYEIEEFDIETQQKIGSLLSSIDEKIALNEQINKNLVEQVFALYDNTFPRMEGPSCRADEFFNITIGKTPPRKEPEWFSEESINTKWVSISDMGSCGLYISDSSEYLVPEAVSKFNVVVVPDNTVLLSFKLTVGRVAITDGIMTTNEAIAHFKTDKKEINPYLYCYLKRFNFQTLGSTSSIATAINSKIVKAMPFVIPSDTDLAQFNEVALPAFEMIKLNLRENRSLAATRDLLLPKLMSGEIDVSDLSI